MQIKITDIPEPPNNVRYCNPRAAHDHIAKSGDDTAVTRFTRLVTDIMKRDNVERTVAMRKARRVARQISGV